VSDIEKFAADLVLPVADRLPGLPAPAELGKGLKTAFRDAVGRERERRGDVTSPADVAAMVIAVEGIRDLYGDYARVFKAVADDAKAVLGEELVAVHGEHDGIPQGRLNVADVDGSLITVKPNTETRYDIDTGQVLKVVALWLATEWADKPDYLNPQEDPVTFAIAVAERVLAMVGAKAKLLVTHARGLVAQLRAAGEDTLAEVAEDAITSVEIPKGDGVQVARLTPEQLAHARGRKAS
jgi:hypothetical protein